MTMELSQCVLDGKGMANESVGANFKEKKRRKKLNVDAIQFGFMPGIGTTEAHLDPQARSDYAHFLAIPNDAL